MSNVLKMPASSEEREQSGVSISSPDTAKSKPKKSPPSLASAISGALSGSIISACVQPLDVVRTKMQGDAAKGIARGTMSTAMEVVRSNGIRGLWQGTGPSVLRVGLGAGLHFVLLEHIKGALLQLAAQQDARDGKSGARPALSALGAAMSGGLSRAVSTMLLCPITVVKTRMEYSTNDPSAFRYNSTAHALATIARTEGPRGLFRGLAPTVLTNAPFSGLYYMFYTQLQNQLSAPERPQTLVNFGCGCAAAVAATLLTQPADVVRTRMQLSMAAGAAGMGPIATLHAALKQQGMAALLTGAAPRMLKRTMQTALVWTLYEELVPRFSQLITLAGSQLPQPDFGNQAAGKGSSQRNAAAMQSGADSKGKLPPAAAMTLSTVVVPLSLDDQDGQ